MKQKSYILNIGNPCSESWSEMTPVTGGRFCAHCSKTVIDFSTLTDDEIIKIISQRKDNLCGRFYTQQLNREIAPQPATHARKGFYKYAASIFLLFVSKNVFSFTNNKIDLRKENIVANPAPAKEQNIATDSLIKEIRGRVLDSATNEPISAAALSIKGTNYGTYTSSTGNYILEIPDKFVNQDITIVVAYIGYNAQQVEIKNDELNKNHDFYLSPLSSDSFSLGVIMYSPKHKKHWWQFWKKS